MQICRFPLQCVPMSPLHILIGGVESDSLTPYPHLGKLLARSRMLDAPVDASYTSALARLFQIGVADLAAISLAADAVDPGDQGWFFADPVHLMAGMHSLTLFDSRHFQLDARTTAALIDSLNQHFEGEIVFLATQPTRWYARFQHRPEVSVPALDQVAGRAVQLDQITGPDVRTYQRLAMEIQMVLSRHPVNTEREARNEPTLNGVWLWGGGKLAKPRRPFSQVIADDHFASALARHNGAEQHAVMGLAAPARPSAGMLIALPDSNRLAELDTRWLQPSLTDLQRGRLDAIQLILPKWGQFSLGPWQARAFWHNTIFRHQINTATG